MFLKKLLVNEKDKKAASQISKDFERITEKEGQLIDLIAKAEYNNSYMSMLLLKAEFLIKEIENLIDGINKLGSSKEVKQIYLTTAYEQLKRIIKLSKTLKQVIDELKINSTLETEVKKQEVLHNLTSIIEKEKV